LLATSNFAKTDPNATCNSSAQLFGEYLHAFEDTFAHRSQENAPYSPMASGLGFGHFIGGKNPDYTYNHFSREVPGIGFWNTNEARTLQMEKEVFLKMQSFSNPANAQYSISAIKYTLDAFNSFNASESSGDLAAKIAILNDGLKTLGYKGIVMKYKNTTAGYDPEAAKKNRDESLNRLNPNDYIGTILPQGAAALPKSKK
jgi:hypothetical protein